MSYSTLMTGSRDPIGDDALARRWQPALRAFFMRRLHDAAEAEDLTQDVLLRLIQQDGTRSDSYVFQIAQNLLIDRQRRTSVREGFVRHSLIDGPGNSNPIDAQAVLEGRQHLALIEAALRSLPERTRSIFILYRFEKMSQGEIALAFGISPSAVKQQVAKAMAVLARTMRDDR